MDKPSPTSYVRMVDIWLITCQLLPFLEVIILTTKELSVETVRFNHRGFVREIKENPKLKTNAISNVNPDQVNEILVNRIPDAEIAKQDIENALPCGSENKLAFIKKIGLYYNIV